MTDDGFSGRERSLLDALKMVHRKHCMNDDSIGWDELEERVVGVLCDVMGDENYLAWMEDLYDGIYS